MQFDLFIFLHVSVPLYVGIPLKFTLRAFTGLLLFLMRITLKNGRMSVLPLERAAKDARRSESMGGIGAAQSANQGIEQKTRT